MKVYADLCRATVPRTRHAFLPRVVRARSESRGFKGTLRTYVRTVLVRLNPWSSPPPPLLPPLPSCSSSSSSPRIFWRIFCTAHTRTFDEFRDSSGAIRKLSRTRFSLSLPLTSSPQVSGRAKLIRKLSIRLLHDGALRPLMTGLVLPYSSSGARRRWHCSFGALAG